MSILEFIGYVVESIALAMWSSRPVCAIRRVLYSELGQIYIFTSLVVVWSFLCVIGLA